VGCNITRLHTQFKTENNRKLTFEVGTVSQKVLNDCQMGRVEEYLIRFISLVFPAWCKHFEPPHTVECYSSIWLDAGNLTIIELEVLQQRNLL